jgi:hypothetical protein
VKKSTQNRKVSQKIHASILKMLFLSPAVILEGANATEGSRRKKQTRFFAPLRMTSGKTGRILRFTQNDKKILSCRHPRGSDSDRRISQEKTGRILRSAQNDENAPPSSSNEVKDLGGENGPDSSLRSE